MNAIATIGAFLRERQRWVLVALLGVLHLLLLAGVGTTVGLMLWFVDVGLFLLWQPFLHAERQLRFGSLALIVLLLAGGGWLFGWWLLILWVIMLASLLGGRVMVLAHRPTRIFYLLAFAYLLAALLIWLVPKVVPDTSLVGLSLDRPFGGFAPLVFLAMLLLPWSREIRLPASGVIDFFYSLFIFLMMISVLVLGSLAFMLLRQAVYIEAVFKTLISMAAMLLLIAWAWNPRPRFSGIGVFFSRYLLSIGVPFETWLQRMMDCAERECSPEVFLSSALDGLLELPWVCGGRWVSPGGKYSGEFGQPSVFHEIFVCKSLEITLHTRQKLSPALIWHFNMLLQLTGEYYSAKRRERQLKQMSYVQAVHETGARLTHDVKNLLQSLKNLCFMAQAAEGADALRVGQVLQRQLPQVANRLQQTLEKLQAPMSPQDEHREESSRPVAAWWSALRQRYAQDGVEFAPVAFDEGGHVPAFLFDSVADNLLQNCLLKKQSENGLRIRVSLSADARVLCVCDDGSAVRERVAENLFDAPVPSENGLGIGLFYAARHAGGFGHELRLASNEDGKVCFELRRL